METIWIDDNRQLRKEIFMIDKNLILIEYLRQVEKGNTLQFELQQPLRGYTFKSEYSTNDQNLKVVVVSQRPTEKQVLWCGKKLFEAFQIEVFGDSIRDEKEVANSIGELIGDNVTTTYDGKNYQIMFMQMSNPQSVVYDDIRRVAYTMILRTLINEI